MNKKLQYPKTLPVTTRPIASGVARAVTGLFELDSLKHEIQFGNFSHFHQIFIRRDLQYDILFVSIAVDNSITRLENKTDTTRPILPKFLQDFLQKM